MLDDSEEAAKSFLQQLKIINGFEGESRNFSLYFKEKIEPDIYPIEKNKQITFPTYFKAYINGLIMTLGVNNWENMKSVSLNIILY